MTKCEHSPIAQASQPYLEWEIQPLQNFNMKDYQIPGYYYYCTTQNLRGGTTQ
jgi:hypothetical protein